MKPPSKREQKTSINGTKIEATTTTELFSRSAQQSIFLESFQAFFAILFTQQLITRADMVDYLLLLKSFMLRLLIETHWFMSTIKRAEVIVVKLLLRYSLQRLSYG